MAYLHKRTFDILGRDRLGYVPMDDLFYVDDALAETIQILNTRGYTTVACRAGEAFPTTQLVTLYNVHDSRGGVVREADVIAVVEDCDGCEARLTERNRFSVGDTVELVNRGEKPHRFVVSDLRDGEGMPIDCARHPMMELRMRLPAAAEKYSILRKIKT